jgi:ribosome biogenesis GTPase
LIESILERNKTYILVGSSGVGKSSLINAFTQEPTQRTNEVSGFNQKGKHTTTSRELFQLYNGSLLIDSPGMREFGVTTFDGESSADLFPAISEFAQHCRFQDCKHVQESGCAVLAAVSNGDLEELIYASYVKLMKEQRRFELTASDKKRMGKQTGKMIREAKDFRNRFKGG